MFSRMEEKDEIVGDHLHKSLVTREEMIHAQEVLRTSVAFRTKAANPIKWRHVAMDLSSYLAVKSLNNEIREHFGTFVQYQLFQHPKVWPAFLPAEWNALS
jgi:hypothetical protein